MFTSALTAVREQSQRPSLTKLTVSAPIDATAHERKMKLSRAEYKEIVRWTERLRPTRQGMKMLKDRFPK